MTERRRVVVTGLGIVSPAGSDPQTFWTNLTAGRSFVRRIDRFDASTFPTQIAAPADESSIPDELRGYDRITRFALAATDAALADAALTADGRAPRVSPPDEKRQQAAALQSAADAAQLHPSERGAFGGLKPAAPLRSGVVFASGMGTYGHREIFPACSAAAASGDFDWATFHALARELREERSAERRSPGSVATLVARRAGFRGPVMSVMTACAAGTQALGDAARWIRDGRAGVVLAGGSDSELYPMGLASFCLLRALSRRNDDPQCASRPFSGGRDGFVIGEGAAVLVLEELHHALDRGAKIYAELSGFGSASDAYRVTDPHPDGTGAVQAMTQAMREARVTSDEVGYVNAHGTSTVANDRIETAAVRKVFGDRAPRIPISSTKSMIGHLTVAAGAAEAVATVLSLAAQQVHPTINHEEADPECDLDYVPNVARAATIDSALSNSFAFGGQCASVLFTRFRERGA